MARCFGPASVVHHDAVPKTEGKATQIGVLASRDNASVNLALMSVLEHFYELRGKKKLSKFHFVFTGGTYNRIFFGDKRLKIPAISKKVAEWYHTNGRVTKLPESGQGGVTMLSYLITQRQCSIVWPFYAPMEIHWLRPENLALMRLCDQWHVKRLMNRGSVLVWLDLEAAEDAERNLKPSPPYLTLFPDDQKTPKYCTLDYETSLLTPWKRKGSGLTQKPANSRKAFSSMSIALIAHDEMKSRMIEFALDYEAELDKFGRILATGTTGREVSAALSRSMSNKMIRAHSGPKGGDIEIATAVLCDQCDIVVFFIDPLRPHPHIEDIRVVFEACMVKDQVIMITNEMHAREFMSRVVRTREILSLYS